MSLPLLFILLVLGVSRLVRLVQADHVTERFRETLIFNRWPYDAARGGLLAEWLPERREIQFRVRRSLGREDVVPTRFAYWLHCPWCLGTWATAGAVVVVAQLVDVPLPLLWWAAGSQCVGWLANYDLPRRARTP